MTVLVVGSVSGFINLSQAAEGRFQIVAASSLMDLQAKLTRHAVDCICVMNLDQAVSVHELFQVAHRVHKSTPVVFYTNDATGEDVQTLALRGGRVCDPEKINLRGLLEFMEDIIANEVQLPATPTDACDELLIGQSAAMQAVREIIRLVSRRKSTVLISGDTGTGKDLAARAIHRLSDRHEREMVSVNCAALPDTLLEAELFGHTKGAFTGAVSQRCGRFEQAQRSTLFLDEIGEMPLETQAKLLRVIQERELQRIGSSETVKIDVRVVAASNVDLAAAVRDRRFRQDLLYRLRVVELRMPALHERLEDLPELADHFVKKICDREEIPLKRLDSAVYDYLCTYNWPGNVRELEHMIESAVVLTGDRRVLTAQDFNLPVAARPNLAPISLPASGIDLDEFVSSVEAALLDQAMRRAMGNKARAADMLGIPRTTLISKVKALRVAS